MSLSLEDRFKAEAQVEAFIEILARRYGLKEDEIPEIVDNLKWLSSHRHGLSRVSWTAGLAVVTLGASGDAVPLCNVANTWAENQTFGKAAGFDAEISPSATTGAITIDWRDGNRCKFTPTGNCTLTFTAPGVRCKLTLIVTSGATPYTITQPGSTVAMGTAPSTVANKDTMYQYDWDGSEYRWMGVTEP